MNVLLKAFIIKKDLIEMKRFEKIFFGILIGSAFPLFLGLLSVIIWFYFDSSEKHAPFYLLAGLILGLFIDLKNLNGWMNNRYNLPVWFLIAMYLFYNVLLFGFFMGFPVFNILMGVVAGIYIGHSFVFKKTHRIKDSVIIKNVSVFTGIVMILICISSAIIALAGNGVGKDLQSMLGLDFEVSEPMIWGIILIGGFLLISIQIIITKLSIIKTIKYYDYKQRN